MTEEECKAALGNITDYVSFYDGGVVLDGHFTINELRVILTAIERGWGK